MSKGGHGAAAASVLMLKKSEDRRQESALREAFKVNNIVWVLVAFVKPLRVITKPWPYFFLSSIAEARMIDVILWSDNFPETSFSKFYRIYTTSQSL